MTVDTTIIAGTGPVRLRWYDPTTGNYTAISASEAQTANRSITYPANHSDGTSDWVLVVDNSPVPDTEAPSVPSNLTVTGTTGNSVSLSWTASTDNIAVSGYKIFRDGVQVGTSVSTSFTDTGLTPNTSYVYTIKAYDASANESAASTPVTGTTQSPDTQAPSAPNNLASNNVTNNQVGLTWTASTDNVGVIGYQVYRNGIQVGTSAATSFTDTGLSANTTYAYTVAAYDAANNVSPQSSSINVTTSSVPIGTPTFVQQAYATPQTNQTTVLVTYPQAQTAGNTNIIAVGWNNVTSNITSLTDSSGNTYVLAVPVVRGANESQAIYYAKNIVSAPAGGNMITATFDASTAYVDLRITEYSGLDQTNPFDIGASASGSASSATTPNVTTTKPIELIFAAGMTSGAYNNALTPFTTRVITNPDMDIVFDRAVTSTGNYNASVTQNGNWVLQIAIFKAAGQ